MQYGRTLLGRRHVLPGVTRQLHEIQVEGTFHDGCAHYASCAISANVLKVYSW